MQAALPANYDIPDLMVDTANANLGRARRPAVCSEYQYTFTSPWI